MISRRIAVTILCLAVAFGGFFALGLPGEESRQNIPTGVLSERPIAADGGQIGKRLRKWYSEGTAAGNIGDYYDNRDGGHSNLNMEPYPQLQRIEYTEEQIKDNEHWSAQRKILPRIVFGNSSTSAPPNQGGSIVRSYYVNPGGLKFLFTQYIRNNLYIYPEHRDHDPGNNGIGGYGDLFPTNTPFLIASQGSSGSDQAFMRAMPYVLAAFRPEVKEKLVQTGLLMPTIQMILRITNRQISKHEEYLTGKAHPTVFRGSDVNVEQMVEMAHKITLSTIPPIAQIKVVKEDTPINGIDYFEPEQTEILVDTPVVIARIFRGSNHVRKMTVSAQESRDINKRPLKFHWVVLRGDPDRIQIEYLNQAHSIAEITIPYFRRAPIDEGSDLESNRIDIGVFVHNGEYYSPPAFITFYTLDSEARAYGSEGKPLEIAYDVKTSTVSVVDWAAFFNVLNPQAQSWPCKFLRRQFKAREISGLLKISDDFYKIHEELIAARQKQEEASTAADAVNAAIKALETSHAAAEQLHKTEQSKESRLSLVKLTEELDEMRKSHKKAVVAAQEALKKTSSVQKSEKEILEKKTSHLNQGASALVHDVLNSMVKDPNLWIRDREELELLYQSAGKEAQDAYEKIKATFILYNMAENSQGMVFHLKPILEDRLTHFEQELVANLNAIILSHIVFPGIVNSERRERYVDHRIASAKEWQDVYLYAPDGTPMGWRRYQSDGINEFNADGLLVLDKDLQGRCTRARLVRYELEPKRKDSQGNLTEPFRRKVKMVPTDMIREYEYEGVDDWRGYIKRRYLAK